jgi:hypothetical protein
MPFVPKIADAAMRKTGFAIQRNISPASCSANWSECWHGSSGNAYYRAWRQEGVWLVEVMNLKSAFLLHVVFVA